MDEKIRYRGRVVDDADVLFIRELIGGHPEASRRRLSELLWTYPVSVDSSGLVSLLTLQCFDSYSIGDLCSRRSDDFGSRALPRWTQSRPASPPGECGYRSSQTSFPVVAGASSWGYPHAPEGGPQETSRTGACG